MQFFNQSHGHSNFVGGEAHDVFQILQRKSRFYGVNAHRLLAESWSPLEAEEIVDLTTGDRLLGQRHRILKVVGLPPIDELQA